MPEVRRDKFSEGVILSKTAFADAACNRESPFKAADSAAAEALPEDIKLAIQHIVARGKGIVEDRRKRMRLLEDIAESLEPMRRALDKHKCATAASIAADFNIAWTAAVIDAMKWPDTALPVGYLQGFPVVFNIPDSGVFREDPMPATISEEEFMAANTRMVSTLTEEIERSVASGDPEKIERRKQCWMRTKEEIDEGLIGAAVSRAVMDRKYRRGRWRCLGRSAIKQKGKWRCIDNGKRSKHNRASSIYERITCGRADFPAMAAREFARASRQRGRGVTKRVLRMRHGTNDLRAAYRHVPTSQPQFTCVAVWDADAKKVVYCDVPGHNFGLKSAVVNFNRFPELATVAARRLLWCVSEHYYDDNDTAEPDFCKGSGQKVLVVLCGGKFFGFPFDPNKDETMRESNEYLGVTTSYARVDAGVVLMDVTTKRRDKLRELVRQILRDRSLPSGIAGSLFGKARFALSPCFGSLGKACLQPIQARADQRHSSGLTAELADSIEFIEFVCDALPPVELPLEPCSLDPVVIFTDAEGKKRDGHVLPTGHLGFVVIHPVHGRRYASAAVPPDWVKLFDRIKERQTYIGQFELAAAITPFLSLPADWFAGRPVELWVDNTGAVGALVKGYSGVPDCARIVNMFHFAIAKLGLASLWIDYVPSESNPGDIPSRLHEMSAAEAERELRDFGEPVDMTVPRFADANGDWLSSVSVAASVWGRP